VAEEATIVVDFFKRCVRQKEPLKEPVTQEQRDQDSG
jgi:hypothetical protein